MTLLSKISWIPLCLLTRGSEHSAKNGLDLTVSVSFSLPLESLKFAEKVSAPTLCLPSCQTEQLPSASALEEILQTGK